MDRLNYELGEGFYLYGHKEDLANAFTQNATTGFSQYLPVPEGKKSFSMFERRQLLPEYNPCQLGVGEAFFRPTATAEKRPFADNLAEYRKRYKTVKWDTFTTQMKFFADTLAVARQRGIKVIVMAMPITDLNRTLIAPYAYDAYLESVKAMADAKGATFIDLEASKAFQLSDFMDTVHLHPGGGKKMLDLLADRVATEGSIQLALNLPAKPNAQTADSNPTTNPTPVAALKAHSL
jgi:hypothetical protein